MGRIFMRKTSAFVIVIPLHREMSPMGVFPQTVPLNRLPWTDVAAPVCFIYKAKYFSPILDGYL